MNIALPFICLYHEQVRNVPSNMILVACCITAENFLESVFSRDTVSSVFQLKLGVNVHPRVGKRTITVLPLDQ
jgi:hypothetical protein